MQKHVYKTMYAGEWKKVEVRAVQKTHIQKHRLCSFVLSTGLELYNVHIPKD